LRHVAHVPSERFIACLGRIVLECRCGEKLILLGRKRDWRKEGRTAFECGGCRKRLFLDDIPRRRA